MLSLSDWGTTDRRTLVHLERCVLEVFARHVQLIGSSRESGGILLGRVRGSNLEIIEATVPSRFDERFPFLFIRKARQHRQIADERWRCSGGTVRYLGEWHTHPEELPQPSSVDLVEWRTLSAKRNDGRPLLAVIVGRAGLHVEFINDAGQRLVLESIR
ncbi:integrative and conjugative element protein (TIGR02256 family) [Janthinobacterium sp. 67]|uniref:Mov34/MPN/PAD-1 family protein n=1 Tax=Janthinobacterium sp. 67 TaxID=2035207 RepID=UPI000C24643F|nr:Mov34/MPN/PAD-1 family protein [Janthinobacterium sp. 67]PJJ18876.1 integrative and conjugative element protein (TIGR02256 family) [Janthinobacterium sp. 67]